MVVIHVFRGRDGIVRKRSGHSVSFLRVLGYDAVGQVQRNHFLFRVDSGVISMLYTRSFFQDTHFLSEIRWTQEKPENCGNLSAAGRILLLYTDRRWICGTGCRFGIDGSQVPVYNKT